MEAVATQEVQKSTMRVAQLSGAGGEWELVERKIPQPSAGQVRIKVEACGVCHSDALVKEGLWPGLQYPRIPGHEVIGRIDALGPGVENWRPGQKVGVGWHGGHCFVCDSCRRGNFITCARGKVTGISYDGGYAEYMTAPAEAVAAVPEDLPSAEAAPLLCAGITVFNAMRNSGARSGDLVAVHGIGGLGHLGVQFACKMGFHTVAIARGADKAPLAAQLGAHEYIDATRVDPVEELQKRGGANLVLGTAPDASAMASLITGLKAGGKLLVIAVPGAPLTVSALDIVLTQRTVAGWPSGTAIDSEDTLRFSQREQVLPMVEKFPLERVAEAYERMTSSKARFRAVLTMGAN